MSAIPARWYWVHQGRQGGPVTWDELQGLAQRGKLRGDDLVLREGTQQWKPAATARADEPSSDPAVSDAAVVPPPPPTLAAGPAVVAQPVDLDDVQDVSPHPKTAGRGMKMMVYGTLLFVGGILASVASYQLSQSLLGGRYIIFRVPIFWGIILFCRGIAQAGSDD